MNHSEKIEQVVAALYQVHAALENPRHDSRAKVATKSGGSYEYEYLSLPALIDHLKPHLNAADLFVTQEPLGGGGFAEVVTTVWHKSGEWLSFGPAFMPASGTAQDHGGAITYDRRYALASVFNLAADKDDDAASSGRGVTESSPSRPTASPAEPAPASTGEGLNGAGSVLASEQQWANLLAAVDGKPKVALAIINEKNGTTYETFRIAKDTATQRELEKAVEG